MGSLYQFFPNKLSLAEALRDGYIKNIEQSWISLGRQASAISAKELSCRVVELQVEIMKNHPAMLKLLEVPPVSHARRELIRTRIAEMLMAHQPRLSSGRALRVASVVQQVSRGLLSLFAQTSASEKAEILEEFNAVLTGYLVPQLKGERSSPSSKAGRSRLAASVRKGVKIEQHLP